MLDEFSNQFGWQGPVERECIPMAFVHVVAGNDFAGMGLAQDFGAGGIAF